MSETTNITAIDYYWRPGCPFCMSLERGLSKAGIPMNKFNIWDDPAHAATVRSLASGNETVPTVVIDGVAMVNPRASAVLDLLAKKAPELVPANHKTSKPGGSGKLRRLFGG
jgi:glutaredoxin